MSTIKSFRELKVWQKSIDMTIEIYRIIKKLPKEELYSLSDQMKRAAVSIPSNIAEGQARNKGKEFIRFLRIALGSRAEIETQLTICRRLDYISESDISVVMGMCNEIEMMLYGLITSIKAKMNKEKSDSSNDK